MIDELVLEQLLAEIAEEIAVPVDGAERVVHELSMSAAAPRRPSPRATRLLMVAAAVAVVLGGIAVAARTDGGSSSSRAAAPARPTTRSGATPTTLAGFPAGTPVTLPVGNKGLKGAPGAPGLSPQGGTGVPGGLQGDEGIAGAQGPVGATGAQGLIGQDAGIPGPQGPSGAVGATGPNGSAASGPLSPADGAKIIKNGSLDLQVPRGRLQVAVNRVTNVAVGLAGYIANSHTSFSARDATAQITLRVPSANFEAAISRLTRLRDVTVLDQSENGLDVTAAFVDLQARLAAETAERDSLLGLLANADNLNDILSLHDRESAVQTRVDQLQGQINLIGNQAAVSSIGITVSEKAVANVAVHKAAAKPATGLSKAWNDSRHGFSGGIEWLLARSGGALIILLAVLALLFGIRYLYPVVRRGLL